MDCDVCNEAYDGCCEHPECPVDQEPSPVRPLNFEDKNYDLYDREDHNPLVDDREVLDDEEEEQSP